MSRVPRIRFKGFEEDWEQRKLGEVVVIERGGSPRPIEKYITESNDGLNWIKIGDAPIQGRYITKTSEKIKKSGLSKTRQVFPGDLILSNSMSFGKPYIMGIEGCIHDGWLVIKNKNNVFDLKFLCHMLSTEYLFNQYKMFAAGSTVNNLNKELVGNASVRFPKMLEQRKIGKHLESLDHLITLHQRKLEKLKIIKKSMLENLFPQSEEKTPKIRFSGFTKDWEQRKLGEVADIIGGGTPSTLNSDYWDGNIDWYSPAEIIDQIYMYKSQRKITELGLEKSSAKMLPIGTVLFTSRAGIGKTAILAKRGCTNQGFQSIVPYSNTLDSYFIFSRTEELKKYGELVGAGSTFVEVSGRQMENMQLMIPKTIGEQHIIGLLFSTLDHLITLHQSKLEKLQKIKKSMLESMFV